MASQDLSDKTTDVATDHGKILSTDCVFQSNANEGIADKPLLNISGLVHPEAQREKIASMTSEDIQITATSLIETNSTSLVVETASTMATTSTLQPVATTNTVQAICTIAGSSCQITHASSNIRQATINDVTDSTTLKTSDTISAATLSASESCLAIPAATTTAVISTSATTESVKAVNTAVSMPVKSYSTEIKPTGNNILTDATSIVMPAATTVTTSSTLAAVESVNNQDGSELLPTLKETSTKAGISKRNHTTKRAKRSNTSDSKNICVRFEGNQSKRWDGKEVLIDYDRMKEQIDATQLFPGSAINIPWPIKGGETQICKGVVVSVDGASMGQDTATTAEKKAKGIKAKQCTLKNKGKGA